MFCRYNDTQKMLSAELPSFVSGFLESFEDLRAQEQDKMTQSQENIVSLLEHCSRVRKRVQVGNGDRKEGN